MQLQQLTEKPAVSPPSATESKRGAKTSRIVLISSALRPNCESDFRVLPQPASSIRFALVSFAAFVDSRWRSSGLIIFVISVSDGKATRTASLNDSPKSTL